MKPFALANIGSWILIIPLSVASIRHGWICFHFWGCLAFADNYIDPVVFILSYLAPVAILGVVSLVLLQRYNKTTTRSVILATSLFLFFTGGMLVFGIWYLHRTHAPSGHFLLSEHVWWLKPFTTI